jgi:DNA-binding transcriptional LysR family regulator
MDENITIRQLRYCVALGEHLHFGRAAESAGIAQPPLSVQIRELESRVGVKMFYRTARRVQLTPAGEAFVRHAREILAAIAEAASEARRVAAGESGRLRIAYPSSLLDTGLSSIVARFRSSRPSVKIDLVEAPSPQHARLIREEKVDAGFARDAENADGVTVHRLFRERLLLALPAAHELARSAVVHPRQLAGVPLVFFPRQAHPRLYDRIIAVLHAAGVTPQITQESNEWVTVVALVQAGLGVSIVPESFRVARSTHVRFRRFRTSAASEVSLCVPARDLPPLVAQFLELALEQSASHRRGRSQTPGESIRGRHGRPAQPSQRRSR